MQGHVSLRRSEVGAVSRDADAIAAAFAELYQQHWGRVHGFLRYRLNDPVLAEDLTAEVFARAWRSWTTRGQPPTDEAAQAWLFITARNLATDHFRRRRPIYPLHDVPASLHPTSDSPEMDALVDDTVARIERCVTHLGEREREIVGLRLVAGLRNGDIAEITKTSEGNVAKIIHRALKKVRLCLTEESMSDA